MEVDHTWIWNRGIIFLDSTGSNLSVGTFNKKWLTLLLIDRQIYRENLIMKDNEVLHARVKENWGLI